MTRRGLGTGTTVDADLITEYTRQGWWIEESSHALLRRWAAEKPDAVAIVDDAGEHTWADYWARVQEMATLIGQMPLDDDACLAVWLPDSLDFHAALVAGALAGVVVLGVGARASHVELVHLMGRSGAQGLIMRPEHKGIDGDRVIADLRAADVDVRSWLVVEPALRLSMTVETSVTPQQREPFGPNDFVLLNSTSGTTGLPKLVAHTENQWFCFSVLAQQAADLGESDVIGAFVPGPFGFGLWTSHYAPLYYGATTVLMERFEVGRALQLIAERRISMLCCVSTQFKMMLNSPDLVTEQLTSLRVMYTGGEAVPAPKAREFEERTGAAVLQFFGSNEGGACSMTTPAMTPYQRLETAGQVLPMMDVALYDDGGEVMPMPGGPGQPADRGPLMSLGYYRDDAANDQLFSRDGRMLMADLVTVDDDGFIRVVGRKSDIIIRGGKNISAPQVESVVETHPAVALCAVVPVPDEIFGERVCVVVEPHAGQHLTLDELKEYLAAEGLSRESWPEYLVEMVDMPRSVGAKLAKRQIREQAMAALGLAAE